MNFSFILPSTFLLILEVLSVDIKKLFHEKDLSELCKRRVIPSIFLGRHVVEASAFILHFAKLDLPYNCFISVRSESGSNMIMVINLPIESGLARSCIEHSPQFVVYEMGETFGGYWGAIPESLFNYDTTPLKYYTLKTTEPPTRKNTPRSRKTTRKKITTQTIVSAKTQQTEEMIEVEIPLVEVSGILVPGDGVPAKPFDYDAAFDYRFDVTPIPGETYDTSILPLVQLAVRKKPGSRRGDSQDEEPRYDIDIMQDYTPDSRLTQPLLTPAIINKHRPNVNRRFQFGKKHITKNRRPTSRKTTRRRSMFTKYVFPTTRPRIKPSQLIQNKANNSVSWETIDELIEHLNKHNNYEINEEKDHTNRSRTAQNIFNMKHNKSIYLNPKLSNYERLPTKYNPRVSLSPLTPSSTKLFTDVNLFKNKLTTISTVAVQEKQATTSKVQQIQEKTTNNKRSSIRLPNETSQPVSLVDHESWENIVQVAPDMAVLLNQSQHKVNKSHRSSLNKTYRKALARKKRAIHSISIENGRPHRLTTMATTPTTTKKPFNVADMQEFVKLVELQDDDMHGRVALRYLKQYVGPPIYNICGEENPYSRHVYLFNTSRIVLSLNNFSLSHMSLILTRAGTLLNSRMQCPNSQLECQVSGARVCVDSLAACDGVPNCGSYDIYDEDRLMCGAALGLQRNVCLAALAVLILLLTVYYAIHYWLKRCVPKVADAFFVYTDGVENILYLQTVMRPPGDNDNKPFFTSYNAEFNTEYIHEPQKSLCSRFWNKCFFCFKKKDTKEDNDPEMLEPGGYKKNYSFLQSELSHFRHPTVDTSVQTGDSLEMTPRVLPNDNSPKQTSHTLPEFKKIRESPIMIKDSLLTLDEPLPEDELSMLKFFRDSRTKSIDSLMNHEKVLRYFEFSPSETESDLGGEIEVSSIVYEKRDKHKPGPSRPEIKSSLVTIPNQTRRRIRFQEGSTKIPSSESLDNIEVIEEDEYSQRSTHSKSQGRPKAGRTSLTTIKEDDESASKPRHFWEVKGKKLKKKTMR